MTSRGRREAVPRSVSRWLSLSLSLGASGFGQDVGEIVRSGCSQKK